MVSMVLDAGGEINSSGEVDFEACLHEFMEGVFLFHSVMVDQEVACLLPLLI
jgi:hypothetical protein